MQKIYKITKTANFSPLVQEYHPYIKPEQQYCAVCGSKNKFDIGEEYKYSTWTGNKIHALRLVCENGGAEHSDIKLLDIYEWKLDGKLYTGDFSDQNQYIESLKG